MGILQQVRSPKDLKNVCPEKIDDLADEIRELIVDTVSRTGGHLGPNLGVVELIIAIHRVFESPRDSIIFDTGHQAYVHKLLTGRQSAFGTLRRRGGISGYPSREESEHDLVENSHASTALSYADGLAKANHLRGRGDRAVVAVVGDGAMTGGMAWEAINNIAAAPDRPIIVVLNDNQWSYAPTVGGFASYLASLHGESKPKPDGFNIEPAAGTCMAPADGRSVRQGGIPRAGEFFEDLGMRYIGPIDGHDVPALELALRQAKELCAPVVVHVITSKGHGYGPAEADTVDHLHAVGANSPATGRLRKARGKTWTSVFAAEMLAIGEVRSDVVAVTAAMLVPVGLEAFAEKFPERTFDVGIAEQHAVASAAGLALGGFHPVVAIYATFLNRAFDQILMDVALHRAGVTFVLDRAGVTGPDGPSHNGVWDMSLLQVVPGLRLAAPRDACQLRIQLGEALQITDGPTVIRFPKAEVGPDIPALFCTGGVDVLYRHGERDVLLIAIGIMAHVCLEVAERLIDQGIGVTVVDPRWVIPVNAEIAALAATHRFVATVEDNGRVGGIGAAVAQMLRDALINTPTREFGLPRRFLDQGERAEVLADAGLTAQDVSRVIIERVAVLARPASRVASVIRASSDISVVAGARACSPDRQGGWRDTGPPWMALSVEAAQP